MPKPPIQLKRSGTASATPSSLEHGELAINYHVADGKMFWKDSNNVIRSFTLLEAPKPTLTFSGGTATPLVLELSQDVT